MNITFLHPREFVFVTIAAWLLIVSADQASAQEPVRREESARNFARTAETVLAPVYEPLARQIVSEFGLADSAGIGIDLGGGPGNLVVELGKKTPCMHWINADINPAVSPYVTKAAENAGLSGHISAVVTDAQDLVFRDSYADIIVSRGSFHLWADRKKAFAEIYRVLKPGGTAFIGRGFPDNLPVDVARRIREQQGGGPVYDVNETAHELENIMKLLGIENYRIRIHRPPGGEAINYGIWLEFHKPRQH